MITGCGTPGTDGGTGAGSMIKSAISSTVAVGKVAVVAAADPRSARSPARGFQSRTSVADAGTASAD
jgi:hypothetical protein